MKPLIVAALISLPLVGIVIFFPPNKTMPSNQNTNTSVSGRPSGAEIDSDIQNSLMPAKLGTLTEDDNNRIRQMREETSRLGTAAALLVTEDVQRGMVNKAMETREQLYQQLFDKWDSSDVEVEAVLDVIRRRETRLISIRTEAQKKGSDAVLKSIRVIDSERAVYAEELQRLLGTDKMSEFTELDNLENNRFRKMVHKVLD